MQTVLVTGGTGTIGKLLCLRLVDHGYKVIIVSRKERRSNNEQLSFAQWNVEAQTIDAVAIQKADHIINLAGAGVMDKRWTPAYKQLIQQSRIKSGELIVAALKKYPNKVKTVINASAIGWYGPDKNPVQPFVETDPADKSYLGETCRLWEESIAPVEQLGKRLVKLRTGIVLTNNGGALPEFKLSLKFGVAAILGNGKQIISWIHAEDLCRAYIHAIKNESMNGAYNAVAPEPVSNKEFMLKLARKTKRFFIPMYVPGFVLKLILGEKSIEVLKSATVSNNKIQQSGFDFLYPTVDEALQQLTAK